MMFCPKCGSLMMPKMDGKNRVLACSCGFVKGGDVTITEQTKKSNDIHIVEESKAQVNVVIDAECPKCKHGKAEYWEVQTRSADEPPTRFHKCLSCKHTWREYK